MSDSHQVIIGLGTGRCGTTSLTELLMRQEGVAAMHESRPRLSWVRNAQCLQRKMEHIRRLPNPVVAEIGFYFLPYVEDILEFWPSAKFVCLKRDKEAVVDSYMRKTHGRNHWMRHDGVQWRKDRIWDPLYPKIDAEHKREAISKYCDQYHHRAVELEKSIRNFQIFDVECLNTRGGVEKILSFCGIKNAKVMIGIQRNAGGGAK